MTPEVSARVDADVLAQGGTRLNFDAHDLAEAPGESRYSSQTRYASRPFLKNAGARLGLMLTGAALATAAHAVFALVGDGTGFVVEQGSIPILGAWVRKFLSLAFGAPADPVRKFLARADVLGETSVSVETFKRAGYERREDFWGITETELENALQVTSPVHRRRVVRLADRMKASSARNDRFTETGVSILLFLICSAAFLVIIAACVNKTFRNRLGVYLGITCAICWFHMKTYLERVRLNKLKKNALRGLNKSGSHNARPTTTRSTTQSVSLVSKSSLKSVVGGETHHQHDVFQDDDSAFEGSRQGSPDRGIFVPSVTKQTVTPAGLTGSLCDATTREAVFLFREKWRLASSFRKARAELHNWRKSREEYPEYESELAKLKLLVPESEVTDATLRLCGDLDDTYRRFLSAQGGKAVKAEKMLRNTIEWRAKTDLVGKMRVWRDIPFDVRQKTYEGYQSGWYSSHTSLGCPVYIERTGKLHLAKVLKLLSADDVVDHHIRMMEWMMRVLMPEMRKREAEWSDRKAATKAESMKNSMEGSPGGSPGGEQSEDDDNDEASPYPASDKVINVLDMSGLSTRILGRASIEIFKRCLHIDQSFFPEIMYRCYVVNCPAMFRVVWAAVKPLLDKQIQKKIFIYGKVAGRVKDEMVDLFGGVERVPSFLGGECKRELFNCPPWVLKHMDDDKFVSWEVPIYPEAARG